MSGICGIVHFDRRPASAADIEGMLGSMLNSGSDREGIWCFGAAGLGYTALWTTPESRHEEQPVISRDGNLVLVADARIDNRDDLLGQIGVIVPPGEIVTDADLIMLSYEKWGDDCAQHLLGDFSFAIFDLYRQELLLARDHLGFRPLYYVQSGRTFAFSSELIPLFSLGLVPRDPDLESLEYLLLLDAVPFDKTCFKGVSRLVGGNLMKIGRNGCACRRYWNIEEIEPRYEVTFDEAVEEFLALFAKAVKARLRTAYPLGFELSGGLDSSSVLAYADEIGIEKPYRPFSLRFGSMPCDEGQYIDAVCARLGVDTTDIDVDTLDFSNRYSLAEFYRKPKDWPADLFFVPHMALAEAAKSKGVRVILTGQGGDEVLQGSRWIYHDYLKALKLPELMSELNHSSSKAHDLITYLLRPLAPAAARELFGFARTCLHPADARKASARRRQLAEGNSFPRRRGQPMSAWDTARMLANAEAALWRDSSVYNLYGGHGIEVRHPMFDVRLIEARLSLPVDYFYRQGVFKVLLREAMKGILPEGVRNRRDKADFGAVVRQQLASEKNRVHAEPRGFNGGIERLFEPGTWAMKTRSHAKSGWDDHEAFLDWRLTNLLNWQRVNLPT